MKKFLPVMSFSFVHFSFVRLKRKCRPEYSPDILTMRPCDLYSKGLHLEIFQVKKKPVVIQHSFLKQIP